MKPLNPETLHEFIVSWANHQLAYGRETTAVLDDLRTDFGMTDRDIRDLGLDYLWCDEDETEPNEPQKKKYTVHIREVWEGDITVIAADEEEALDKVYSADIYSTTEDLAMIDWDADATEETE